MRFAPAVIVFVLAGCLPLADSAGQAQPPKRFFVANGRAEPSRPMTAEEQRRRVDYIRKRWIDEQRHILSPSSVGASLLSSGDEQTSYMLIRRATSSEVELHTRWDDLVIVRSGAGVVEFGKRVPGIARRAPGEWRGGTITNPVRLEIAAGDIVRIPAAVPHLFRVVGAQPLEFILVKQRRGELPLRLADSVRVAAGP
jgi:mannose-6-phosphate isomerase-like protein (cupin superfamily)